MVLGGEQAAVALAEHGDFFVANDVAAALSERNLLDAAEIDGGGVVVMGFMCCLTFQEEPPRTHDYISTKSV